MPAARTGTFGRPPRSARGFTLVELVVTIAVGSVVVAFMALFIVMPMNAYTAQTRRASLVDASDSALRFMARDLRSSLPNSVRVTSSGTVTALELLATADGARYQDGGPLSNPALALNFGNDTSWRASRSKAQCTSTSTQTAHTAIGTSVQYYCLYQTARLTYSATLISTP